MPIPIWSCSGAAGLRVPIHHRSTDSFRFTTLALAVALAMSLLLPACADSGGSDDSQDDTGPTAVSSGTLSGYAFTVIAGTLYQEVDDGPVSADGAGGSLAFDTSIAELGLTVPGELRLLAGVSYDEEGSIVVSAYGQTADGFAGALRAALSRAETDWAYALSSAATVNAAGAVLPTPADSDAALRLTVEFYDGAVPGYGDPSGVTLWHPEDGVAGFCDEIDASRSSFVPNGDELALTLLSATVESVSFPADAVGPCE